jgi:osmotically-inducible protein OsmY
MNSRAHRCLALLLPSVLAVLAAACSSLPPRSAAERSADAQLAAEVEAALDADAALFARHIDVSVERGKVYLGGYVWSVDDLYRAPQDARGVPGVTAVDSQVQLLRGGRGSGR